MIRGWEVGVRRGWEVRGPVVVIRELIEGGLEAEAVVSVGYLDTRLQIQPAHVYCGSRWEKSWEETRKSGKHPNFFFHLAP